MGPLFVILFHLIFIFIVASILAFVFTIFSAFLQNKKKRKIVFALLSPFIFCYSLYFFALIGSAIVSTIKDVDMGIGDYWYVPLNDNVKLSFIDSSDNCFLETDQDQLSNVEEIQQIKNDYYIKTSDKSYLLKNNSDDFIETVIPSEVKLLDSWDFYFKKKFEVSGSLLIFFGMISLVLSCFVIYLLKIIVIGRNVSKR
ncbi:hypothetical protein [Empedobacter tilapiae]|uniref:hypothetical protein n=1 Tax=Empedobacter tilapiae TaxID=2491114 RepID=UPI0028D171DA|nr:hypothetical protein [Empedobacter tilapiae]